MTEQRPFDVVIWGASGFTGRLVADYMLKQYGVNGAVRWAIAGRNQAKLEQIRARLGDAAREIAILIADGHDLNSLQTLARQTRVVCSTVGPYALYGSLLVAACVETGTDYCDLTGEVQWMRKMIDAHQTAAEASGARIVHTCGFDSIPSDMGVFYIQKIMRERHGVVSPQIKYRTATFKGGVSGGTIASLMNVLVEAQRDPTIRKIIGNPYALNPADERRGPDRNEPFKPVFDRDFGLWTAPFFMASVNTRVVRRTNALLGYAYGRDFRYDEAMAMGKGALGYAKALSVSAAFGGVVAAGAFAPTRSLLNRILPESGAGPNEAAREAGMFKILLWGKHPTDASKNVRGSVSGDRDPGYGATAKMLAESAVCLAKDEIAVGGGFWTPASALGESLLQRLQTNAGLSFSS